MGIEPTFSAWEADVLPLNYTRYSLFPRGQTTVIVSLPGKVGRQEQFGSNQNRGLRPIFEFD